MTDLLIVDDHPSDLDSMAEMLCEEGFSVAAAPDAAAALAFLDADRRPRCIVLDFEMPEVDVPVFLASLEERAGLTRLPIIVLSTSLVLRKLLDGGGITNPIAFLAKPVRVATMLLVLERAFKKSDRAYESLQAAHLS